MTERGRSALSAGGVGCPRLGMCETQNPPQCPFGASRSASWACFHLRRLNRRLLALTVPLNPSPYPPDAGRTIIPSRSQWWSYDHGYIVGRLTTVRYLAAGLRRVLLVKQQAQSTVHIAVLSSHSCHFSRRTAQYGTRACPGSLAIVHSEPMAHSHLLGVQRYTQTNSAGCNAHRLA